MTPAEAAVLEVLKWAVNPERPVPDIETLNEEALLGLAAYHRIEARLLARLDKARPIWCPPRLRTRLRIQQHWIRHQAQERMAAAREVSEMMKARGQHPPIFVKGFAAYALTNNLDGLHFSGDLDPFAEDLPALWDVLHEIGYTGKRKDTHEWAKLHRGTITLDLHQHFPMLAYPPDVWAAPAGELEARLNPGHWRLPGQASGLVSTAEPLRWADLKPGAMPGIAAATEEILFPSPTLLCLIHCAHCFRSSVTRLHYMDPRGGFRLCELLAIADLTHLPGFAWDEFAGLTKRFAMHDAVSLVNTLASCFLGGRLFPSGPDPTEPRRTFPEPLMHGGWVSLQQTEDWLRKRSIEQMLNQLGANHLPAQCRLASASPHRLLTCGSAPPQPEVGIDWNPIEKLLTLDWSFPNCPPIPSGYELLIHFGYGTVVKAIFDAEHTLTEIVQKCDYGYMNGYANIHIIGERSFAVRITCPVPTWPDDSVDAPQTLSLFLTVRRFSRNNSVAVTYLPVILRP